MMALSSADECPTCEGTGYVDLSVAAFMQLGTEEEGMVRFPVSSLFHPLAFSQELGKRPHRS
jgi:hypothetical protein